MTTYGSYPLRTAKLNSGDWVNVGDSVIFGEYETKWTGTVEKLYYCYGRFAVIGLDGGEVKWTERVAVLELGGVEQ